MVRWREEAKGPVRREQALACELVGRRPVPFVGVAVWYQCFGVFTEFVPNKRIVDKWSLALEDSETATFDVEGSGTRVTLQCHRRSFWRLWPLNKLVDRFEGQESERALAKLKEFMEATDAPLKMAG